MDFVKTLLKVLSKVSLSFGFTKNETKNQTLPPTMPQNININITNENKTEEKPEEKPRIIREIFFIKEPEDNVSGVDFEEIIVGIKDDTGLPVENIPITIKINVDSVALYGQLLKLTDKAGCASFKKLMIKKSGNYKLQASYGELLVYSNSFHIYPVASDIDFQKYKCGSQEELNSFITAAIIKKNPKDKIIYNGEEL